MFVQRTKLLGAKTLRMKTPKSPRKPESVRAAWHDLIGIVWLEPTIARWPCANYRRHYVHEAFLKTKHVYYTHIVVEVNIWRSRLADGLTARGSVGQAFREGRTRDTFAFEPDGSSKTIPNGDQRDLESKTKKRKSFSWI